MAMTADVFLAALQALGHPVEAVGLVNRAEAGWDVVTRPLDGLMVRLEWQAGASDVQKAAARLAAQTLTQADYDAAAERERTAQVGQGVVVRLAANRTNSLITLADATGLSWQLKANTHYLFEFYGSFTAAAGATGIGLAVNGPGTPTLLRVNACVAESAQASRNAVLTAYDQTLLGQTSAGPTPLPFWLDGAVTTGAAGGPFVLRFRSEVAGNAVTVLAGSYGVLRAVG